MKVIGCAIHLKKKYITFCLNFIKEQIQIIIFNILIVSTEEESFLGYIGLTNNKSAGKEAKN